MKNSAVATKHHPAFWVLEVGRFVIVGLTFWVAWQFCSGEMPHPLQWLSEHVPYMTAYSQRPVFQSDDFFSLLVFPVYYVTGIGVYLVLGFAVHEIVRFVLVVLQIGFSEAWAQERRLVKRARRMELHAQALREKERAARQPASAGGWSLGAVAFGVWLGWLLF